MSVERRVYKSLAYQLLMDYFLNIYIEKCELFLELFGNSLIRPQTSEYLQEKANEYIR